MNRLPVKRPAPAPARLSYVAVPSAAIDPLSGDLDSSLSSIEVKAVPAPTTPARSLMELRGYRAEDLDAIADIGVQYLYAGALIAARTVFEGLAAIDPRNPFFAMALGLTYEREGKVDAALESYDRASRLDPSEGRAEVNAAELLFARRELAKARPLLIRAVKAAAARGDAALEKKARALFDHLKVLESKR